MNNLKELTDNAKTHYQYTFSRSQASFQDSLSPTSAYIFLFFFVNRYKKEPKKSSAS